MVNSHKRRFRRATSFPTPQATSSYISWDNLVGHMNTSSPHKPPSKLTKKGGSRNFTNSQSHAQTTQFSLATIASMVQEVHSHQHVPLDGVFPRISTTNPEDRKGGLAFATTNYALRFALIVVMKGINTCYAQKHVYVAIHRLFKMAISLILVFTKPMINFKIPCLCANLTPIKMLHMLMNG